MPVSELAFDRPGAGSPFGDDIEFPVPPERLTYEHPEADGRARDERGRGDQREPDAH
jgi:hypothetical protein